MEQIKKPIIVPWDFSEIAEYALLHAAKYAELLKEQVALLHIVKSKKEIEEATQKLNETAESYAKKLGKKPLIIVREGSIFTAITDTIEETDAVLAVMGTHGMKGMQKFTGSWALKVIVGSRCPFIVVQAPPQKEQIRDIVFPVDFRAEEKEKLIWANYLARLYNPKFHICRQDSADQWIKKKINANLAVAAKYLSEKNIEYEMVTLEGKKFVTEITDYAQQINAGLIVVMTTKNIRFQDYVLGASEQQLIANETKIPVMCINPRPDLTKMGSFS